MNLVKYISNNIFNNKLRIKKVTLRFPRLAY